MTTRFLPTAFRRRPTKNKERNENSIIMFLVCASVKFADGMLPSDQMKRNTSRKKRNRHQKGVEQETVTKYITAGRQKETRE